MSNTKFSDINVEGRLDANVTQNYETIARNGKFFIKLWLYDGYEKHDCYVFDDEPVFEKVKQLEQGCLVTVFVRKGEIFRDDAPNFKILDITPKTYIPPLDNEEVGKLARVALDEIDKEQRELVMKCWKGLKSKDHPAGVVAYAFKGGLSLCLYDLLNMIYAFKDLKPAQKNMCITLAFLSLVGCVDYYSFNDNNGFVKKTLKGTQFSRNYLSNKVVIQNIDSTKMNEDQKDFVLHSLNYWNTPRCMSIEGKLLRSFYKAVLDFRTADAVKNRMLGDIKNGFLLADYDLLATDEPMAKESL